MAVSQKDVSVLASVGRDGLPQESAVNSWHGILGGWFFTCPLTTSSKMNIVIYIFIRVYTRLCSHGHVMLTQGFGATVS